MTRALIVAVSAYVIACPVQTAPAQCVPFLAGEFFNAIDEVFVPAFGVTVETNGSYAVVGSHATDSFQGDPICLVYRVEWVNGTFTTIFEQALQGPGLARSLGSSFTVAGDTILFGDRTASAFREGTGAVLVYDRQAFGTWLLSGVIAAQDSQSSDAFGSDVALEYNLGSGGQEGVTAIVGAYNHSSVVERGGAVYVFVRSGLVWTQVAKFAPDDLTPEAGFGNVIASDQGRALIGAPWADEQFPSSGSAYVYRRDGNDWVQEAKLLPSIAGERNLFGMKLALTDPIAVVGVPEFGVGASRSGAVFIFRRTGTTWTEEAVLRLPDPRQDDFFGRSVSTDGERVLIGAPGRNNDDGLETGMVYIYEVDEGQWKLAHRISPSPAIPHSVFGVSLALERGTGSAIIGASGRNLALIEGQAQTSGTCFVLDLRPPPLGDTDRNYRIDFDDISNVLNNFGAVYTNPFQDGDADRDQDVDFNDLSFVLRYLGQRCNP